MVSCCKLDNHSTNQLRFSPPLLQGFGADIAQVFNPQLNRMKEGVKLLPQLLHPTWSLPAWQDSLPTRRPIKDASNGEHQRGVYPVWLHGEEEQMNRYSGTLWSMLPILAFTKRAKVWLSSPGWGVVLSILGPSQTHHCPLVLNLPCEWSTLGKISCREMSTRLAGSRTSNFSFLRMRPLRKF